MRRPSVAPVCRSYPPNRSQEEEVGGASASAAPQPPQLQLQQQQQQQQQQEQQEQQREQQQQEQQAQQLGKQQASAPPSSLSGEEKEEELMGQQEQQEQQEEQEEQEQQQQEQQEQRAEADEEEEVVDPEELEALREAIRQRVADVATAQFSSARAIEAANDRVAAALSQPLVVQLYRLRSDLRNAKSRFAKEQVEERDQAVIQCLSKVLPLLDNLERSFVYLKPATDAEREIMEQYRTVQRLTRRGRSRSSTGQCR
ncbi:hypothetical protein FOA52_004022 [Chlamydomonas sp. UWO 241]|nr:hypothetical protein FOA52_004022 [Chlamydomonas sp. UWO 241]